MTDMPMHNCSSTDTVTFALVKHS